MEETFNKFQYHFLNKSPLKIEDDFLTESRISVLKL